MPARKKIPGKKQIIRAIQSVARKLGHTPIQAEFVRMTGINVRAIQRHFNGFPTAVNEAGLRWQSGKKVETAAILQDWAEVARRLGHIPGYKEYGRQGRYSTTIIYRRFRRWEKLKEAFLAFVESGSLKGEWMDVMEMVRDGEIASMTDESCGFNQSFRRRRLPPRPVLPIAVAGHKCVTPTMLGAFVAHVTGIQFWSSGFLFNRRVLPDRPLLGPPMQRNAMSYEPVNEMGVVMLFSMWADRLGFVIEFAQARYPDCKAKMEVEPGRWQDVNVEFELNSSTFVEHGHDPDKCDLLICWKHDWAECPERIMVLELSRLVGMSG
jgi:HNH endonuclease